MSARNSYNVAPIPGDNNGGSGGGGGGGGPSADGGVPIGTVVPFASATTPPKWLICNGTEYREDEYDELFTSIGYNFGPAPATTTFSVVSYSTAAPNVITFTNPSVANPFLKIGTYVRLSGFTAITGPNINGLIVRITGAPTVGTINGGNYSAAPETPIPAIGNGAVGTLTRYSFQVPDFRLASPIGAQTGTINFGTSGGSATTTLTANNLPQHRHGYNLAAGNGYGAADGSNGNRAAQVQNYTNGDQTYLNDGTNTLVGNTPFSTRNPYVALNYIIKAET